MGYLIIGWQTEKIENTVLMVDSQVRLAQYRGKQDMEVFEYLPPLDSVHDDKNTEDKACRKVFPMLNPPTDSFLKKFINSEGNEASIFIERSNFIACPVHESRYNTNIIQDNSYSFQYGNFSQPQVEERVSLIYINCAKLGFLPSERAEDYDMSIPEIIRKHFQVRSTKRIRFEHKLWNALCITKRYPQLFSVFGVEWITGTILKVHRTIFAQLLGITRPTAALFNSQGSFPSHGFVEIDQDDKAMKESGISLYDSDGAHIRYLVHSSGLFTAYSGIDSLVNCRWKTSVIDPDE